MSDERDDRYLWDRSGPGDPEVERLEELLAPLGQRGRPPLALPARRRARGPAAWWPSLATAAAVVLVAGGGWLLYRAYSAGWAVQSVTGAPVVGGVPIEKSGAGVRLRVGEWVTTDATSRARLSVGRVGRVDVDPDTRVQLVQAGTDEQRMSLVRGTIHAQIWAPPKLFYVNTPSAVAIDLGCAYTLQVDDAGAGILRVTAGWVAFERDGRESFIPAGAMCATRPGVGPGTPRYEDAPSGFGEALATLDFGSLEDPQRTAALDLILSRARPLDALTLWHLLPRGTPAERARVCERLAALAPPPRGVSCEAVLRGEQAARDQWWDSLGRESNWWKLWKRKMVDPR
jgi:hypothetical protein